MTTIIDSLRTRQTNILFLIMFTDMIGFGMAIPLFGLLFGSATNPFYVGNIIDAANIAIYFGLFTALFGLGQFFANPILGALSDNIGRKPVLSFAIFGTLMSRIIFLFGLVNMNISLMFFSRFLDGATGGIMSLSNASITDTTTSENRGKYIGKVMAGFSLGGFVFGPIIFTLFSYTGEYWSVVGPFVLAAFMSLVAFTLTILFFPETLPKEKIHEIPSISFLFQKLLHSLDNLKTVLQEKSARPFFLASGVFYFAFTSYTTFASQYLFSKYNLSADATGIYFLVVGVTMTIMQAFVAHKLVRQVDMVKKIVLLSQLLALSMIVFAFAYLSNYSNLLIFTNAFVFSVFVSVNMVFMQFEISKIKTEHKGALMGAFSSVQVLAMALAPILAGMLAHFDTRIPFVFGAVMIVVSGVLLRRSLS